VYRDVACAQPETGHFVVPDEIFLAGLGLINDTLAELRHVTCSGGCAAFRWTAAVEAPRQHPGGNSGSSQDICFDVGERHFGLALPVERAISRRASPLIWGQKANFAALYQELNAKACHIKAR